ncbi:hypothetical protein HN51_063001 [Arachis hypogaea]
MEALLKLNNGDGMTEMTHMTHMKREAHGKATHENAAYGGGSVFSLGKKDAREDQIIPNRNFQQ